MAALLLIASVLLDVKHLSFALAGPWRPVPLDQSSVLPAGSMDAYRAYQLLEKDTGSSALLFFEDFVPLPVDLSLEWATSDRNALVDKKLPPEKASWAAVLVNANEAPFLKERFAGSHWVWLDQGEGVPDGGWALGYWRVTDENREVMMTWVRVHERFRALDRLSENLSDGEPGEPLLARLGDVTPLLGDDRFLWSCYWRKVRALRSRDRDYRGDVEAIHQAQTRGYPSSDLDYLLGSIQMRKKEFDAARVSLRRAETRPVNLTASKAALRMVDEVERYPQWIGDAPPLR